MPQPENALAPFIADDGPSFSEGWQAQALGMAHCLVEAQVITAAQWSERLGACLRQELKRDDMDHYYASVLKALTSLLEENGVDANLLLDREADWKRAYHNTPHGQPVELANANRSHHD